MKHPTQFFFFSLKSKTDLIPSLQHIFREKKTELVFWFSHDFMNLAKPMNLSESVALSVKWYEDLHLHIKEVLNTKTFEMYKNVLSTWYIFLFISCIFKDRCFMTL